MPAQRTGAFLDAGRSVDDATERVKLVESLGYDSVWLSHIAAREPMQVVNRWAAATSPVTPEGTAATMLNFSKLRP